MGQESAGSEKGQARSFISAPPKNSCRWLLLKYLLAFKYMMPTLWLKSNKMGENRYWPGRNDVNSISFGSSDSTLRSTMNQILLKKKVFSELQKSEKQKIETRKSLPARMGKLIACKKRMMHEIRGQDGYTATRKFHILCRSEARRG